MLEILKTKYDKYSNITFMTYFPFIMSCLGILMQLLIIIFYGLSESVIIFTIVIVYVTFMLSIITCVYSCYNKQKSDSL